MTSTSITLLMGLFWILCPTVVMSMRLPSITLEHTSSLPPAIMIQLGLFGHQIGPLRPVLVVSQAVAVDNHPDVVVPVTSLGR